MILITTGAGKVGQHVVTQLAQKKVPARAGFRTQDKASALQAPGIEAVVVDFESRESIAAALRGIDTMFLVTAGAPEQAHQEENILAEARKANLKRIVKLSGKITERHTKGFSVWNREAERRIKATAIPYTILRGNTFMQNFLFRAAQIKQGTFTLGPGHLRQAFIDARDIAATAVAALTEEGHAGKTYEVNGPQALDGLGTAAAFSSALGRPITYMDMAADDYCKRLSSMGMPEWMVESVRVVASEDNRDRGDQSSADTDRVLRRKLTTLEEFVKEHRAAFQP
jgi:uncharacterized protein YbjT (DUF2867 family)